MTTRKQLYNGWFMAALSAVMLVCGICIEKKVNDTWLNSSLLEGRSRGIVSFIELSKKVFDTGDRDLMRRFLEDSYTRREQLGKGADSKDFLVFWTNWETDADEAMRARRGLSPSALDAHVGECCSAVLSSTQWPNAPKNMTLRATWNYEGMRGIMALNGSNVCQNVAATAVAGNSKTKDPVQSEKVLTAEEIVAAFSSENKKEGLKQQANRGCAKIGISTATYCDPSNEHFLIIYEIYDPSGNGALKRGSVSGQVNAEKMCAENVRSNGADTNTHVTVEVVERKNDFRSLSVPKKCKSTDPDWGLRLIVHDGDDVVCDAVVY